MRRKPLRAGSLAIDCYFCREGRAIGVSTLHKEALQKFQVVVDPFPEEDAH